jgi:N,N'-diacetyllegionaminate synthase
MIEINNQKIENYGKPFIVAEAGINHNGELEKAFKMIEVAKNSGADAVKFQTFKSSEIFADKDQTFTYKSKGVEVVEPALKMFKRYEFTCNEWVKIKQKCDDKGILFLSTPQNRSDLDLLLELGLSAIKVGSDDFNNLPLLKDYATTKLPMIVSCGMSDLAEVYQALEVIGTFDGYPTILLLCTSQYPTPPEDVNLLKLKTLSNAFPDLVLGFSDHTQGILASSLAVGFGAVFFEKHFTLDNNLPGPDHWFSENPSNLTLWVDSIQQSYQMMGNALIRPTPNERINKKEFQRVLVADSNINQGDIFTSSNLAAQRVPNGFGLSPSLAKEIIGLKSNKTFKKGKIITL